MSSSAFCVSAVSAWRERKAETPCTRRRSCATSKADGDAPAATGDFGARECTGEPAEGTLPGEPLFVPRPGGSDEDDGAVLAMATDADGGTSLYVLDAKDMSLLARARSPIGLPAGFHGEFVPS